MKKNKKSKKDADKLRKKDEKQLKKLHKKDEKQLKKIHKKDEKEKKKIRKRIKTAFDGGRLNAEKISLNDLKHHENNRNKLFDKLTKSVVLNKTMIEKDNERLKKWQGDYYNEMFVQFKELLVKHNEAMNFNLQELTDKIDKKQKELENIIEQIKKRKEELAIPVEK